MLSIFTNITSNKTSLPQSTDNFLKRPVLDIFLQNSFKKPLTVVVAGAGFGKTQAVLSSLNSTTTYKWSWMQLSELDNYINRFWERITLLLIRENQSSYNKLISSGFPESIASFDYFLSLIIDEFAKSEHFVFVFDDFHSIYNKNIINFIELFTSTCIPNFSVVIISRKKPEINLIGMLYKGLLTKVVEDDLRFSKKEMTDFFYNQNIKFPDPMLENIYYYTNGWIFAIYLIGLTAKKNNFENQNPILIAKMDIFELIESEIFKGASKKLQKLLIKVSILDNIPVGLLNEITNYDFYLISEMMQISMFIHHDLSSNSYRMHQLFKKFLHEKTKQLSEEEIYNIHLLAAEWYKNSKYKSKAIYYYEKCECYDEIFNIILSMDRSRRRCLQQRWGMSFVCLLVKEKHPPFGCHRRNNDESGLSTLDG